MATEYKPAPKAEVGGRNIDPETSRKIDGELECDQTKTVYTRKHTGGKLVPKQCEIVQH